MYLYHLHLIARRLLHLRTPCLLLAMAGVLLSAYALLTPRQLSGLFLSVALLLTMWPLMLFAFIQIFQHIPGPVLPLDSVLDRLRGRLRLGLYHVLAWTVGIVGVTLMTMSMKLLFLRQG